MYVYCSIDKMLFLDIIIDDDVGEEGEGKETIPYQLSREAVVMNMKVADITVRTQRRKREGGGVRGGGGGGGGGNSNVVLVI